MLPDRVSNPGPLTYESGALPIALRGPAAQLKNSASFNSKGSGQSCTVSSEPVLYVLIEGSLQTHNLWIQSLGCFCCLCYATFSTFSFDSAQILLRCTQYLYNV